MPKFQRKTKHERKIEIQQCAKAVFLKKGFRNTTMEDIVAATSLSKGGVYQYYKSTKTILFDIMQNGNYLRYEQTKSLIKQLPPTASPAEMMTQAFMAKIFDEVPEKKLYLMFLSEILYDKDYEELFFALERQSLELFVHNMHLSLQEETIVLDFIKTHSYFFIRIMNGILVMHELFSDKQVFLQHKEKIHALIFTAMQELFSAHPEIAEKMKNLTTHNNEEKIAGGSPL